MLLSVIVPVYNVEEYIGDCLESVISQTYRELEIIVVDDGSTDGSGKICDTYALKDPRIIVIHQENQGLSCARNTGLEQCHGDYITFIDSDDFYGTPDVLEQNLRLMEEDEGIDVVQFPVLRSDKGERENVFPKVVVQDREEIFKQFFISNIKTNVWNKIYRANLLSDIHFPPGVLFEDLIFTLAVLERSPRYLLSNLGFYFYRQRAGSIMNSDMSPQKHRDLFWAYTKRLQSSIKETPRLYGVQYNILGFLFYNYLNVPACRQFYHEQGYDYFKLIPSLSQKTGKIILCFNYYLYRLVGRKICNQVVKSEFFLRRLYLRIK